MAAGCLLLGNRESAPCSGTQGHGTVLEDTIDRLRRCLRFASTDEDETKQSPLLVVSAEATCSEEDRCPSSDSHMVGDEQQVPSGAEAEGVASASAPQPSVVLEDSRFHDKFEIVNYVDETQIGDIVRMITKDLSEPYSIYTYRYFIHNWPELCFLAVEKATGRNVGAIVCKMDTSEEGRRRGYIAMLAVDEAFRCHGIGTRLVKQVCATMQANDCDEVVLETEVTNLDAQRLYVNLGFVREKRLFRYYLNGVDAFRLKLFFTAPPLKRNRSL